MQVCCPLVRRGDLCHGLLVEGCSIRAAVRLTGVSKNAIARLLIPLGAACSKYQDETVRGLRSKRVQCHEIWSFVGAKQKNVPEEKADVWGDIWTWTALDADSRLIVSFLVGSRGSSNCYDFMKDVAARIASKSQLTTDGLTWYVDAVDHAFGIDVDYAMIQKHYAGGIAGEKTAASRYSPAKFVNATKEVIRGNLNPRHISTSYVERQNLTMPMSMRRFTRLTNGFSKKAANHAAMVSLYFMYYNFARVHQTLRVTPAVESGIAAHVWSIEEIIELSAKRPLPRSRIQYGKKRKDWQIGRVEGERDSQESKQHGRSEERCRVGAHPASRSQEKVAKRLVLIDWVDSYGSSASWQRLDVEVCAPSYPFVPPPSN
jgi:IS1 family transposase